MTGIYKFAGKLIEVNSLYGLVHDYCAEYRAEGEPDFSVTTTREDIEHERVSNARSSEREGMIRHNSSDEQLEELAVYRKIAEQMPHYGTFLFHGSCVAVDGEGYLFTAKSGTGKSTHTGLWREMLGERAVMVNDDKPLITAAAEGIVIHGTPYNGKHRLGCNISVPLKAVCLLERAETNTIRRISRAEAYPMLIAQTYRPNDGAALAATLPLIDRMADSVALYRLGCNMAPDAAKVAYEGMK